MERGGRPVLEEGAGGFLDALKAVDPDMAVNIEHEDQELDQMEGLQYAADTLLQAARRKDHVDD